MCQFKSFIVTKSGDVLYNYQESHESIINQFKDKYDLRDETIDPGRLLFARVEIMPPNGDVFEKDLDKWTFCLDQSIKPSWFDDCLKKKCFDVLEKYLLEVIIDGQTIDLIDDKSGLFIRNSNINIIKNSQVGVLRENSQVGELWGNSKVFVFSPSSSYKLNDDAIAIEYYHESPIIKVANNNIKIIKQQEI